MVILFNFIELSTYLGSWLQTYNDSCCFSEGYRIE